MNRARSHPHPPFRGLEHLECRWLLANDPIAVDDAYETNEGKPLVANGLSDIAIGLVHRWTFDETSGTVAHDAVGTNDGILHNWAVTEEPWVPGKIGGALAWLDNQDAVVTTAGDSLSQVTVSFWSYRTGQSIDNPRIIGPSAGEMIAANVDFGLGFGILNSNVYAPSLPNLGVWEHYAVTIDNVAHWGQVYRDGTLVSEGPASYTQNGQPWVIGHNQGLDNDRGTWRGLLDDLRIYNRILSSDEVKVLAGTLAPQAPGVLQNDASPDGIPLRAELVTNVQHGTLELAASGAFIYTPNPGFSGIDSFVYQAIGGGSDQGTVTITVHPQPTDPIAVDDKYDLDEDTSFTAATPLDVRAGLMHEWSFDETSGRVAHDSVGDNDLSLMGYGPDDEPWVEGVRGGALAWLNNDNAGQSAFGDVYSRYTFSVWVYRTGQTIDNPRIITPRAADLIAADIDRGLGFGFLSSNVYAPSPPKLNVWEHYVFLVDRVFNTGTVYRDGVKVAEGYFSFNANNQVWIVGHNQGLENPRGTWRGLMDDLRIYKRLLTEDEIKSMTVGQFGVLNNDSDPQNDALTASLVQATAHGALDFRPDGTFTYTPDKNFSGVDQFTYRVSDGAHESKLATVTLSVRPVNSAPVALSESYATDEDTPIDLAAAAIGVLSNDLDPDQDQLSAALVTSPAHGVLTLRADGTFRYAPSKDYFGSDSFTYRATDGRLDSDVTRVTLYVRPVDDAPVAEPDQFEVSAGRELHVLPGVLQNDFDVDGQGTEVTSSLGIDGWFDPWLAGMPPGSRASVGDLAPNESPAEALGTQLVPGAAFSFSASGLVSNSDSFPLEPLIGPDGRLEFVDHWSIDGTGAENGIANLVAPMSSLIGVFLGAGQPDGALAPSSLNFGPLGNVAGGLDYLSLQPQLQQPFFIGDGLTSAGEKQQVVVPTGAVRLYLGTMEQFNWFNNVGSFRVEVAALPGLGQLKAVLVDGPQHGTLELAPAGAFHYVPQPGFSGEDHFTYKVQSGSLESAVAMATIVVKPAPIPGDANGDGTVDLTDFGVLKANFGSGSTRSQGDFNDDHAVDLADFGLLKLNFGHRGSALADDEVLALDLVWQTAVDRVQFDLGAQDLS